MEMNFRNLAPFVDDAVATQDKNNFSLLNVAKDMAGFAIGMAVAGKLSSVGAGAIFKGIEKNNSLFAKGITKAVGTNLNLGSLFRGVRQVAAEAPETIYAATTTEGKQAMQTLSAASKSSIAFGKRGSALYGRLASSESRIARTAGLTAKTFYHSAPVAMGYYAITHALGMEGKDEEHPAWYNIPGHIKGMAAMTANFALTDMALGAIGKPVAGFAKNMATKYLGRDANPGIHDFMDKHFAITRTSEGGAKAGTFLNVILKGAAVADGIRVAGKTISNMVTHTFMQNFGNKAARDAQHSNLFDFSSKRFYKELKNDTQHAFKTAYKSRMDSLRNYRSDYGHDFVSSMNAMIAKHINVESGQLKEQLRTGNYNTLEDAIRTGKGGHLFGDKSFAAAFNGTFEARSLKASKTMGAKILNRQNASVADILTPEEKLHATSMHSYLKTMAGDHTAGVDQVFNNFMKMKAGPNIYKTTGGVVDYSMYNPKNMMNALVGYVSPFMTFNVGFGRELSITKTLGLQQLFAKDGIGIHSIRANEGQHYFDKKEGRKRVVGDDVRGDGARLGGVLVDGELFVTHADGILRNANAAKQKMVYTSHHAREAMLYKVNAQAYRSGETLSAVSKISNLNSKTGMVDKINNFTSRWGLKTPSPVQWAMEGLNKVLGFSPMQTGTRKAVDLLLDPRNTEKSIGGDMSAILNAFSDMGHDSSTKLYNTLSHPRMMARIADLSKDIGGPAQDRVAALSHAFRGSDEEVMNHIRTHNSFATNEELRHGLENYGHFKSEGLTEQVGTKFSIRNKPLTNRQELQRHMLNEVLGMQKLPGKDASFGTFNIAKKLLSDNESLSMLSKENQGHLRMLSTTIDLFHFGYLDGTGKVAANYNGENIKSDALDIIRKNLGEHRHILETKLFDTPMIKDIGVLGFGRSHNDASPFVESYARKLRGEDQMKLQRSPFIMLEAGGTLNQVGFHVNSLIDRMMELGNGVGLRYAQEDRRPYTFKLPYVQGSLFGKQSTIGAPSQKGITLGGPLSSMMKRIAQGVGVIAAANAVDTFTSVSPMFHGTILNNGIYSAGADVLVKGSMAYHKLQDITGVTEFAKYAEGLMPSSTSTIPGMVIGGMMAGPLGIIPGAVANRFAALNGLTPDFEKSYAEKKDIYAGRELVPVRKNRFWMFSKAPYEGDAPAYFRPSWYPRLKSQYKYTDTLYGSKSEAFLYKPWTGLGFNPIGHILDKYHYEKKHYWDRPYATTSAAFTEVPGFGAILGATIGKLPIIGKPIKHMHMDEMSHYYSTDGSNNGSEPGEPSDLAMSKMPKINQIDEHMFMSRDNNASAGRSLYGDNIKRVNPYGAMTVLGEQLYNFTELAGLRGFQLESLMGGGLADSRPRLSTAGDMWSARRAYWDLGLGDIMGSTEFLRRFVPRDKKIWQKINPIRNRFPNWLPSEENSDHSLNFLEGDPYTKIAEGEMRLPGAAYNKLYDVKRAFPSRASSFGNTVADSVKEMLGLSTPFDSEADDVTEKGTAMHRYIQDSMMRAGVGVKAEQLVYDAENDISGHIDLITYDPYHKGGKRVLEIKTVNSNKFNKLKAPIGHHMSQVNFYLRQMHMDVGTLLYVNRDDPSQIRTFDVRYSEERFRKDTKDLQKARKIAAGMVAEGKGYETGTSYSWLDRLRILSDVAPYSNEYKDAVEIVKLQVRDNKLTQDDIAEVQKIKTRRNSVMRKYDMYPTRFKGRVFSPDTKYELASENTNIKAASEYSLGERVIGSFWESGVQMNTPLNTKLWNFQTPLQHYRNTKIYGAESAAWNKPFQDILHPMFNKALSNSNPMDAAASFGWIGAMGFGGMGSMALPGAAFGAMYGAARTVVGNDDWIPDEVQKKRDIVKTFDQLKYLKAMNLYNETGDEKWRTEADNTLWSISQKGYKVGMVQTLRALPTAEKPYFLEWVKETNPVERQHILEMVPTDIANILKANWGMTPGTPEDSGFRNAIPVTGYEGFMDNDNLSDIEVKTINQEGLRATDFGLGWYDQQRRMAGSQFELNPVTDISQVTANNNVASRIKSALMRQLGQLCSRPMIAISIAPSGPDVVKVQLNIMRDRHDDIMQVMRTR